MSVMKCECCGDLYDTDYNDGSWADDGTYLCDDCSLKPDTHHWKATREEIKQHHFEEYQAGVL